MAKVPRKRSINAYRSALLYAKASLEFNPETHGLTESILPMIPKVNALIQTENEWTDSVVKSKGKLLAARQEWKLQFNQLLKEFNTFDYAEIVEVQELVLGVYPRGNRGADYVNQVEVAMPVFAQVLSTEKLPANIKGKLKGIMKSSETVLKLATSLDALIEKKDGMLEKQDTLKTDINRTLDQIDKKLHKLFPYEQRYLGAIFFK
jgi:translation initiation factor IF-2